ncbi:MAG: type II toxin-antitoxin system PemK/MazF family toxin [Planctomyces sp.]|nr:type II toxin-antitoxin system PemK/MazF family toxin [Planctomyces sp.]
MSTPPSPSRGEVWDICFDPSLGAEIQKTRPAVVISVGSVGRLPLRLVVPITDWKEAYCAAPWFVRLPVSSTNGLSKESGADSFQIKSVSLSRFRSIRGKLTDSQMDDIAAAVAICIGL